MRLSQQQENFLIRWCSGVAKQPTKTYSSLWSFLESLDQDIGEIVLERLFPSINKQ